MVESSHSSCISSVLLMQAIICDAMLLAECSFSFCSLVLSSTIIRCFHVLGDSRGCMSNMSLRKSESYFLHAHASTSGRLQPARPHEAVSAPIWQLPAVCRHTIHAHTTRDNPRAYNTYKSRAHERAAPARPPHTHRPSLPPAWPPHTHLPPGRWPRRATLAVAATPLSSPPPAPQSPPFAAADAELLANAAPKVEVPPVASLVRRTDRPMKDGPTAQWPPAGLGTDFTFPPDT